MMIHKQLVGTWKCVQHHWLCEKCKWNAQQDTIYATNRMAKIFFFWRQQRFYGRNWLSDVQQHQSEVEQVLLKWLTKKNKKINKMTYISVFWSRSSIFSCLSMKSDYARTVLRALVPGASKWKPAKCPAGERGNFLSYSSDMYVCDSWGPKESDTTERLNWTELMYVYW